jgi:hypothetical protein
MPSGPGRWAAPIPTPVRGSVFAFCQIRSPIKTGIRVLLVIVL